MLTPAASETSIAGALATVESGDTIVFAAGTYEFKNQLAVGTANGVSIVGAGPGKTVFDFAKQVNAAEDGLFAQSVKNLRFEGFTIENTPGNGTKVLSVTNA